MFSHDEPDSFQLQLMTFRAQDEKRLEFIQTLLDERQSLSAKCLVLDNDLEIQVKARRELQIKASAQENNPFVLLLVDGDHYIFDQQLLKAGAEGGAEAARLLLESVKTHIQELDDGVSSVYAGATQWRVMVRVYANFTGLSAALLRAGFGKSINDLIKFAGGFTRGQPLFDFVDAGTEKEGADHKIRGDWPKTFPCEASLG
ncbi:hypothetical protein MMC13_005985 [Lambiella insularis]|nr:hypothetical protein [Lambiella insularis]